MFLTPTLTSSLTPAPAPDTSDANSSPNPGRSPADIFAQDAIASTMFDELVQLTSVQEALLLLQQARQSGGQGGRAGSFSFPLTACPSA